MILKYFWKTAIKKYAKGHHLESPKKIGEGRGSLEKKKQRYSGTNSCKRNSNSQAR
jgi:hypothetical protein